MFEFLKSLFASRPSDGPLPAARFTADDLAQRLSTSVVHLKGVEISYSSIKIPKRSGGMRALDVPAPVLKAVQRDIHRRLLRGLRAHACATGFERGHSIVTNALPHVGKDVVIRMDLRDFFTSIKAERVKKYFRFIGWDVEAAEILTRLCTHNGALPQGAPTSPRLSNLVNCRLDARLAALAEGRGFSYSRYADDITLSARKTDLHATKRMNPKTLEGLSKQSPRFNDLIWAAKLIIVDEGYRLHMHRKLRISHRHHRQQVTGLVVNDKPNLPRETRRRLRAVAHRLQCGREATLTPEQLAGWQALRNMIATQSDSSL